MVRSRIVSSFLNSKRGFVSDSSGISFLCFLWGGNLRQKLKKKSLSDYDLFLAADKSISDELLSNYQIPKRKIVNLSIPNVYFYFTPFNFFRLKKASLLKKNVEIFLKKKNVL